MSNSDTTEITFALTSLQAMALAYFVKRMDFELVADRSSISVVAGGKSEADLIWLALAELRRALNEAGSAPRPVSPRPARLTPVSGAAKALALVRADAEPHSAGTSGAEGM